MKTDKCKAWFSLPLIITIIFVAFSAPVKAQVLVGENFPISTAPEYQYSVAVAANQNNGEFLVLWYKKTAGVLGQRISSEGTLIGESFLVTDRGSSCAIAFNSQENEFLLVYNDTKPGIFGQRISADGSLIGGEITIFQSYSPVGPAVAYNSISNQYLVVSKSEGVAVVHGQIINHEGMPLGPCFDLSTGLSGAGNPAVAYNSITNQYLVVFDAFSQSVADIFGRIVNADGTLAGPLLAITKADGTQAFPSVTFNTATNQYFVVWSDDRNTGVLGAKTFGQLVNADGSLHGLNVHVSDNTIFPKASYFPNMNQYLVLWTEQTSGTPGNRYLLGQLLTSDLNLPGGVFKVSGSGWALYAALDVNPSTGIALVIWPVERNHESSLSNIYGQLIYVSTPNEAGTNTAANSSTSNDPDTTNDTANVNTSAMVLPITLQSPFNGAVFTSCSMINTYQPSFDWTVTETFSRYSIVFSISPTDFTNPIAKANIQGTKNSWIPSIGLWKRILRSSYNNVSIRDIYWKITGTRGDRTRAETEVRSFRIGSPQASTINTPLEGTILYTSRPETFSFDSNCNTRFRLELSPLSDFKDNTKIRGFFFSTKDPNSETVIKTMVDLTSVAQLIGTGVGYFRIKAWDVIKRETVSPTRSFTINVVEPIRACYRAGSSGAGWITINYPSSGSTTQNASVWVSGETFISPTWWRYCSGSADDTGVTVNWKNCTTGESGRAIQEVKICYGFFWYPYLCDHTWRVLLPLTSGDNFITVTASDPAGNWARQLITVKRVP